MKWLIACLIALSMVTSAFAGEDPYIAIVGNDIGANQFYLSPKYTQFLYDQTIGGVPIIGEAFTTNSALIQPEVCDTNGIAGPNNQPPFRTLGNVNGRITYGDSGFYQWTVRIPKKPSGELNLCIQCGVLKPNAFSFEGFDSVLRCAAETGERTNGPGICVREEVNAGQNPVISAALPTIIATASPGANAPIAYTPFNLTAFRNPGTYDPAFAPVTGAISNDAATQVLNGSSDARILLKTCMDKCVIVKLPITGQINALGQVEEDLSAGDLITVRMVVPRANSVDLYCHHESFKLMGVGENIF